jgi:hypothetical protein
MKEQFEKHSDPPPKVVVRCSDFPAIEPPPPYTSPSGPPYTDQKGLLWIQLLCQLDEIHFNRIIIANECRNSSDSSPSVGSG